MSTSKIEAIFHLFLFFLGLILLVISVGINTAELSLFFILLFFIFVLAGSTMWCLQKFPQCIKNKIEFNPLTALLYPPLPGFLE
jgi:ABC-type polysaccharide/polyol phosphate export permease